MPEAVAMTLDEVTRGTGGRALTPARGALGSASIDSRSVQPGELFCALAGERVDGHDYCAAALAAGAGALLVAQERAADFVAAARAAGAAVIAVADVRRALGDLARARRAALPVTVIGITGSNGKTTTKELLAAVLAAAVGADAVLATRGNLNNDLGVPLTLLRLTPGHRYAVVEMGMSAPGEIAHLCDLAGPQVGVITGIAPAHLEHLGSLAAIARAKGELFAALPAAGIAVFPDDEPLLEAAAARLPAPQRRRFGTSATAAVRLGAVTPRGVAGLTVALVIDGVAVECALPLVGPHNARNAAAAAAAAAALGLAPATIAAGLAHGRPAAHRSTVVELAGRRVIDDCYNANPTSTRAALEMLASLRGPGERGVALLGDMLELGPTAPALHAEVGAAAAALGIDHLVLVGALATAIGAGARAAGLAAERVSAATEASDAAREVLARTRPGDWVLIKGSRGMRLEAALDELRRAGGDT